MPERQESDELLTRFPELARARESYIELLRKPTTFMNLGYTNRQTQFVYPVLKLLEGEGEVATHIYPPYLDFENPEEPWAEHLMVDEVQSRMGYCLTAWRDETMRGWKVLSLKELFLKAIYARNPVVVFEDYPSQIAHIALFKEGADITNLHFLVTELYDTSYTGALLGMKAESTITKIAKTAGLAGTYQATWVDERTKLEFVAKLDAPEDRLTGSDYVSYRRLDPISDAKGALIPFGKKADINKHKVDKVLASKHNN